MTTAPFEPDPYAGREYIAAADPGAGAPEPAPEFGISGEEHENAGDEAGNAESAEPAESPDEEDSDEDEPDRDDAQERT